MKSHFLTNLSILAMVASALVAPVSVKVAAISFMAAGILAVLLAGYGRDIKPVRARASLVAFGAGARGRAELGEAA
jgi:hypothetical protein